MSKRFGARTRQDGLVQSSLVKNWLGVGRFISSIQRNTITLGDNVASNTRAITSVDVVRAYVEWLGFDATPFGTALTEQNFAAVLTNATTVTGSRQTGATPASTVIGGFQVVEFAPGIIRRVQPFIVTIPNASGSATATLGTAVITGKTMLVYGGFKFDAAGAEPQNIYAYLDLTNSTTVTATRGGTGGGTLVYGTAVEFW